MTDPAQPKQPVSGAPRANPGPGSNEPRLEQKHIVLSSHPRKGMVSAPSITWGAPTAKERGPVIGSQANPQQRNVIGVHSGAYGVYRALAIAAGKLSPVHRPDLTNTFPPVDIPPQPQWLGTDRIVSIDPWGHRVAAEFRDEIAAGFDIRPTIAITKARIQLPELQGALAAGRVKADGHVLLENGDTNVVKAAIEPVWYLPGIAERLKISETQLRRALFDQTGAMFTDLVTRPDRKVFLPPIGGITLYIFGSVENLWTGENEIACRVHDECNGSDVFGSDICTCRPYLVHGIEECIQSAQRGGSGLIVYNRKEGRALGEVVKFLVYNARKRNPAGDTAAAYFEKTECVAGVQDVRFQDLMPDVFNWLGMKRIDRWISMSNMKFDAMAAHGIEIVKRIPIPDDMIPRDASVEMDAKKAAGYFTDGTSAVQPTGDLANTKGRGLDKY
jgi:GTP cyclohydrolase II